MSQKKQKVKKARRMTKKEIYALYGIEYQDGYILSPLFGWIKPLLVDGNEKIGKTVYHFSTLAGTAEHTVKVCGHDIAVSATCSQNCPGCYGQRGNYNFDSCETALAVRTVLARLYPDFVKRAILAQIAADKVKYIRIHATGDFFSLEYVDMWREIVKATPCVIYWTYTKEKRAVAAFDDLPNINIVRSVIPGIGYNYGTCAYILDTYKALQERGETVYICRCGVDKEQHCNTCRGCSVNKYVLFLEHSTGYKAEKDPAYETLRAVIENQAKPE